MRNSEPEVVIVTYNSAVHIRECLISLRAAEVGVIVVDNGSQDETLNIVHAEFPEARVLLAGENPGYGVAANLGVAATHSEIVAVANADTVFPEDSLQALAAFVNDHPQVGIAGPQQLFPDGSWEHSYGDIHGLSEAVKAVLGWLALKHVVLRKLARYRRLRAPRRVGYVDGAVLMIRRKAFDEIGGFDSRFHHYCEDSDLCLRLRRAGWDIFTVPSVQVTHVRGGSSTQIEGHSERLLLIQARAFRQFIRKYHSNTYLSLYRILRTLHAWEMLFIYRCLRTFGRAANVPHAAARVLVFERWVRILPELKG